MSVFDVWTTAGGRKIPVCEMDDAHLLNAAALVERWLNKSGSGSVLFVHTHDDENSGWICAACAIRDAREWILGCWSDVLRAEEARRAAIGEFVESQAPSFGAALKHRYEDLLPPKRKR